MNPNRFLALALFAWLAAAPAGEARAQWVQTIGPYGDLYTFATIDSILFAGLNVGVFCSKDSGLTWTSADSGISTSVYALAVSGTNIFAGTDTGVFISKNNGRSWSPSNNGLQFNKVGALAAIGTNIFAGAISYTEPPFPISPTLIGSGVFRSTDNGATWTEIISLSTWQIALVTMDSILIVEADSSPWWAKGSVKWGIYTTDNGFEWSEDSIIPNFNYLHNGSAGYGIDGPMNGISGANVFGEDENGNVFLSTNFGLNWAKVSAGLPSLNGGVWAASGKNLFMGTTDSGVFLLTPNNTSWSAVNSSIIGPDIGYLFVSDGYLFASTGNLFRRPLSEMISPSSAVAEPPPVSTAIRSYPNPFSQSTEIAFTSATAGYADVSVVNILGAPVAHLFSGELDAGEHDFAWDAGMSGHPVAPGSYWCVVRMGGSVERIALSVER